MAGYATDSRREASDLRRRTIALARICETRDSLTLSRAAISCNFTLKSINAEPPYRVAAHK